MLWPILESFCIPGCCALKCKENKKQIATRRYVGFLARVTNLKSQFPPKPFFGQIPNHKEIKKNSVARGKLSKKSYKDKSRSGTCDVFDVYHLNYSNHLFKDCGEIWFGFLSSL